MNQSIRQDQKVFIVMRNAELRQMLAQTLADGGGHQVIEAGDAELARQVMSEHRRAQAFDLILVEISPADITLPKIIREARKMFPAAVIGGVITTKDEYGDYSKLATLAGADMAFSHLKFPAEMHARGFLRSPTFFLGGVAR